MRVPALLAAALVLSLTGCAGGEEGAGCVAVVEIDGVPYYGEAAPDGPVPTTGSLSAVVPACTDTPGADDRDEQVEVQVMEGVPSRVAVLHEGVVHLREGSRMPASAAAWHDSAACTGTGRIRLAGSWEGVSEPAAPHFDGVLDPPYDLLLAVADGPRRFSGSTLEVRVTADTRPVLARSDLRRLGSARLVATTRCSDGGFVAVAIRAD